MELIKVSNTQDIKVSKKADKMSTSWSFFLKTKETFKPVKRQIIDITKKTTQSVPPV